MDPELTRLSANLDQMRVGLRRSLKKLSDAQVAELIKICAAGKIDQLDERVRLLVGLLAVDSIFEIRFTSPFEE